MDTKIIYIAGYGRSGSTLLDIVLSNADKGFTLGEISNVFSERKKVTDSFYEGIFSQTINELNLSEKEIVKIQRADKLGYLYDESYSRFWKTFFDNISKKQEVNFFIDSSKTTWQTLFRPRNMVKSGEDVYIIFLKATYKKVWESALKGSNKDLKKNKALKKKNYFFAIKSILSKLLIDTLTKLIYQKNNYILIKIQYENFVTNTLATINKIKDDFNIPLLGLDEKIVENNFFVPGGYLGNRLRKKGGYIKIKKSH